MLSNFFLIFTGILYIERDSIYKGVAVKTESNSVNLPPIDNNAPCQLDIFYCTLSIIIRQSCNFNLLSERGTPSYLRGKEESLQPTRAARILASSIVIFKGIISVLLKLILIPDKASRV
jgi:hypothetical protein